ncbi:hypothetical protein NE237_029259 [Protea cynaroides]|uniref:VQ domain-containing protein n=1 Tax=Protea cynaroides TaxID=273540 RepID=A0A9Q0JUX6_9MAGN|nr:hypothetical protein NE237_029259 [Protea cynaroides]
MDSGNSGSLQSSSGGDEEYDSRNESISAFLNPSSHVQSIPNPSHHHHQTYLPASSSSALFDPLPNYLDAFSRSPPLPPPSNAANSMLNLDMVWPRGLRSEPTCTNFSTQTQSAPAGRVNPFHVSSSMPLHPVPENGSKLSGSSDQTQTITNPVRNSKKRSRASRRAPTTVLTTDTSNFRAMVQEFTGIPAPPFPRSRLDLFSTASTTMRSSHHLDPPTPPYLLRPFAQKFHPHSSSTSSIANMQNPILTFQSLLQSSGPPPPRYPLTNVPAFGTKSQGSLTIPSTESSQLRMGDFTIADGMGLNEGDPSQAQLKTFNGNYSGPQQRASSSCKMNYSTSSSEFQVEKGPDNVSSRGEGMVDSWICSSD